MLKSLLFIIAFILMHNIGFAQTVVRQSIGTIGGTGSTNGITILQSTGQPYGTYSASGFQPGFIQSVQATTDAELPQVESELTIYPNPANKELYVMSTSMSPNSRIQVVDLSGSVIYNVTSTSTDNFSIDCSGWKPGVYFVLMSDNKNVLKTKVVKK